MRTILVTGLVWWMVLLLAGCSRCAMPGAERDTARSQAVLKAIGDDAGEAAKILDAAQKKAAEAEREVGAAIDTVRAVPEAKSLVGRLDDTRATISREVVPRLDQALRRVEAIRQRVPEAAALVSDQAALVAERDRWQKEAASQKERADSAARKWLLLTAAGGFAGILAGGALFVWLSRKAGLTVGLASLAVFAVSIALYRWFEWFAWGGLVLIGLAIVALGYGLWRNRHAFKTVVLGGQNLKQTLADGVQYTKDEVRRLFNSVHAAAQEDAGGGVSGMVAAVKDGEAT